MKKLITFCIIIFVSYTSDAQNLTFTGVVNVDSMPKAKIFELSKQWFAHAFNSANHVIQYDNAEEGKVIGKGNFTFQGKPFTSGTNSTGPVTFTITIEVKEGRYKYTLTDFSHSLGIVPVEKPKGMMKVGIKDVWKDCNKEAPLIIQSLEDFITGNKTKDNNW